MDKDSRRAMGGRMGGSDFIGFQGGLFLAGGASQVEAAFGSEKSFTLPAAETTFSACIKKE